MQCKLIIQGDEEMRLFSINDLNFNEEDFLDNINEYEDIIPIIEELQNSLSYDEIECVEMNVVINQ